MSYRSFRLVTLSTIAILAGIVLLFIPNPPIATISGILAILIGLVLRFFFGL